MLLVGDVEGTSTSRSRLAAFTPVEFKPTGEDLQVTAIPERAEWETPCETLDAAGFPGVANFNTIGNAPVALTSIGGYRIVSPKCPLALTFQCRSQKM